jgi:hypothetical protein
MKKVIVVSVTAFAFITICSSLILTSCNKKMAEQNSITNDKLNTPMLPVGWGNIPPFGGGGCWYFGTPDPFGGRQCTFPSSPYCHVEPWNGGIFNDHFSAIGALELSPSGQLSASINVTNLDNSILNDWVASTQLQVPIGNEIPYSLIVEAYNAAGITQNIPHYFMPTGNWPIQITNSGATTKILHIVFITTNNVQVALEL